MTNIDASADVATLLELNAAYIHSDQFSDVARYEQFLAPDFTATLPDLILRDRRQFLDLIAQDRPFTDLTAHDVQVRVMGDTTLIHGQVTTPPATTASPARPATPTPTSAEPAAGSASPPTS